jgi:hypothetical protein
VYIPRGACRHVYNTFFRTLILPAPSLCVSSSTSTLRSHRHPIPSLHPISNHPYHLLENQSRFPLVNPASPSYLPRPDPTRTDATRPKEIDRENTCGSKAGTEVSIRPASTPYGTRHTAHGIRSRHMAHGTRHSPRRSFVPSNFPFFNCMHLGTKPKRVRESVGVCECQCGCE